LEVTIKESWIFVKMSSGLYHIWYHIHGRAFCRVVLLAASIKRWPTEFAMEE